MRLAFFLDNRGIAGRGALPDPGLGNPGIGGTEFTVLAVVRLLVGSAVEPRLYLTADQRVEGLPPELVQTVTGLPQALDAAAAAGALGFVFRAGVTPAEAWPALERSPLPLLPWLHNLGCCDQGRYERLPALWRWLLVSGAQLDAFRHSRLARQALVIPNPVAVPPAQQQRPQAWALEARDLAYVGALTPFKGFDRLARQWGRIARACPQAQLRVYGAADLYAGGGAEAALTPYERHCRELLQRGGAADRVVFEGSCGLERYAAFRSVAVGVVNPSGRDETFCLGAAEFSACGIPVVAPRRTALIQTVPDRGSGLLAGSDAELARHAITLLQQPQLAWQLGRAGQRHVQQSYGADVVRAAWQELARQLAGEQPAPAAVPVSTPWWHEQRWLRQLWGQGLLLPGWPSWPEVKVGIKRALQGGGELNARGVGVLAALAALLVWLLVVFGKYGGNPTGLARIGDFFPIVPRLQGQALVVLDGKRGNDGQQFLVLATDPLLLDPASRSALDNPIYRGKRLLYPLLAWLLGAGQPGLIVWMLGLINVACFGVAGGLVARWAQLQQLNVRWGLAVLALPGYWVSFSLGTADLLCTTLILAAALAWREQRLSPLLTSLTAALLTRETALLSWAATALTALWERRWRWLLPLALVPLPLLAWTHVLQTRFLQTVDGLQARLHFSWPGFGLLQKAEQLLGLRSLPDLHPSALERAFDAACYGFWLLSLAVLVATALRGWGQRWLRLTAAAYVLPAVCTSTQILARFPDYTRVWIDISSLCLLALLCVRGPLLRLWLTAAALLSLGYGVGYGWEA